MPAMHFDTCPNGDVINSGGGTFKIIALDAQGHGDNCPLVNIHRHGKRRWFFAAVRCECECHIPAIKQKYVIEELPDTPHVTRYDA